MTEQSVCELSIAAGPNRDAVALLGAGRHIIGSDFICDIMLADKAVSANHASISLSAAPPSADITLDAIDGSIILANGDDLQPGQSRSLALPASFSIGHSVIALRSLQPAAAEPEPELAASAAAPSSRLRLDSTLCVVLALAIALIGFGLRSADPPASQPVGPVALRPAPSTIPTAAMTESLRAKIARMPDFAALTVGEEDGAVVLTGPIEPAAVMKLGPLQRWFDTEWNGRAVLINRTAIQTSEPPPALAIEAVWRGKPASYVLVAGERFLEGAMLDGGWVIQRIEEDSVMLRRQNRLVAVRY